MVAFQEYQQQTEQELEGVYSDLCRKLFQLRNERKSTGRLDRPHLIRQTRREIARVLTALQQKHRCEGNA